jgi:hypothetical protein
VVAVASFFRALFNDPAKLDSFARIVEDCRRERRAFRIENDSIENAAVLAENLLMFARDNKQDVRIISGSLDERVYGNLALLAGEVLRTNKIDIIVEKLPGDHSLIQVVKDHPNGSVREIPDAGPHFILIGDSAYRLEVNHKLAKAVANFNEPVNGTILRDLFDSYSISGNS